MLTFEELQVGQEYTVTILNYPITCTVVKVDPAVGVLLQVGREKEPYQYPLKTLTAVFDSVVSSSVFARHDFANRSDAQRRVTLGTIMAGRQKPTHMSILQLLMLCKEVCTLLTEKEPDREQIGNGVGTLIHALNATLAAFDISDLPLMERLDNDTLKSLVAYEEARRKDGPSKSFEEEMARIEAALKAT